MAVKPLANETDILTKISRGDERAFSEVFYWYARPLSQFVYKLTDSIEITEEIIQNAFVKIWLRKESLDEVHNFGGYLYTICRNEALLELKKEANRVVSHAEFEKDLLQELSLESLDNPIDDYRKLIEVAVAKLPGQQQKVYRMSRYDRLKHEQIAAELNLSPETVKKHIQLAVKFIQNDVNGQMDSSIVLILTSLIFF